MQIIVPPELILAMGINATFFAGAAFIKKQKRTQPATLLVSLEKRKNQATENLEAAAIEEHVRARLEVQTKGAAIDAELDKQHRILHPAPTENGLGTKKSALVKRLEDSQAKKAKAQAEADALTQEWQTAQARIGTSRATIPQQAQLSDMIRGDEIADFDKVDMSKVQVLFFTSFVIVGYTMAIFELFGNNTLLCMKRLSCRPFRRHSRHRWWFPMRVT